MYNKKVLIDVLRKVDAAKAPAKKKDIEVSLEGQWKGKGEYRIPSNQITMQGVGFPVIGKPNVGPPVVMQPGEDYQFPEDVSYVDEVPLDMAKRGGIKSKKYSKSLLATNRLYKKNPLYEKKKYKHKTYDPMAMYFQDGGINSPVQIVPYYNFGSGKSSPEAWEKEIRAVESKIGNPSNWTLEDYNLLQNKLNEYKDWRENTPEGQAVIDYHNEPNEYIVPLPAHLKNYTDAIMKSRLAYANEFNNPAAKRMVNAPDQPYVYTGQEYDRDFNMPVGAPEGAIGTHYMASFGNYAVPFIQQGPAGLYFNELPSYKDKEAIRFDNENDANYFGGHYKEIAPDPSYREYQDGGFKTKLNPEEENEFQNFYNTLPDNLMSDEPDYDIRGYWDALGRPSEFDYSQPKESDGYYHAFSINPNTGEYLKAPFHNTFQHAITEDRKMGWRPTVNVQGRIIATENPSIADPEEQTFLRNTEGPVAYQKGGDISVPELTKAQNGLFVPENFLAYGANPASLDEILALGRGPIRTREIIDLPYAPPPKKIKKKTRKVLDKLFKSEITTLKDPSKPFGETITVKEEIPVYKEEEVPGVLGAYGKPLDIEAPGDNLVEPYQFGQYASEWLNTTPEGRRALRAIKSREESEINRRDMFKREKEAKKAKTKEQRQKLFSKPFGKYTFEDGGYIEAELTQQEIDDLIAQGHRIEEAVPTKAQLGLTMRTGSNIARGLQGASEFRNMMNMLNEADDILPTDIPASVNMAKGLQKVKPKLPSFKPKAPMSFSPSRIAASRPLPPDSFSPIRFGDDYVYKGNEWYYIGPENYLPKDLKKLGLQDASDVLRNYLSGLNPYSPDTFKGVGDFNFKDFSEGSNFRRDMLGFAAGPQRQLSTEDFFTDDELIRMAHQQADYWNARDQFDIDNPEDPTNMIFEALTGDRSRDELFSLLYPNASIPNWREKFILPHQEKITRETLGDMVPGLDNQGKLSKPALKTAIGSFPKEVSSEAAKVRELQDKKGYLFTADPKMVVMEMRGSLGLNFDDIKNASPEQIEKWRQQIIEKVKARDLERYKALLGNPFTAGDAYSKMTLNKYGGVPKAQAGLIKYAPKTASLVSKFLSAPARLSNYLTTQTPLANAYKINPLARIPEGENLIDKFTFSTPFNKDSYYQMLDRAGYNSLLKNGLLQPNFMTGETVRKAYEMPYLVKVNADLTPEGIPFAQMFENIKSGVYDDLTEAQRNNLNFAPVEGEQITAKDPRVTVYKKHWLKGYTPADDFKRSAEDLMTQTFSKRAVPVIEYPKDEKGYIIKDAEPKINVYEWNAPNQVIPGRSKEDVSHKMNSLKKDLDIGFTQDLLSTYFPSAAPRISLARDTPLLVSPEGRLFDSNTRYWLARKYGQQPDINQVLPLQKYAKDYGDLIYSTDDTSIEDSEKILNYKDYFSNPWRKKDGGIPEAQAGLIKGVEKAYKAASPFLRGASIATLGTLNSIAKKVPVMINPIHIPTIGFLAGERSMVGPFTGSPLNYIPGYGKDLAKEMKPNEAFRYFGDTLDYVKLNNNKLDSAHGPLLRMGRSTIINDKGQWFEQGTPNASYTTVFGVRANPDAPGSNLRYMPMGNRNGVLIGDVSSSNPRIINLNDPGATVYRRMPLSERLSPVDLDNPWDWKNYGGNLQALAERYGYAAAYGAGLAAMGYPAYQETLDEYVNEPVSRFVENSKKQMEEFLKGSPVKKK